MDYLSHTNQEKDNRPRVRTTVCFFSFNFQTTTNYSFIFRMASLTILADKVTKKIMEQSLNFKTRPTMQMEHIRTVEGKLVITGDAA